MSDEPVTERPAADASAAPAPTPARHYPGAGLVVVAALFLLLGIFIGRWSGEAGQEETRVWLAETLNQRFAEQETRLQAMIDAARPPDLADSSSRFKVSAGRHRGAGARDCQRGDR